MIVEEKTDDDNDKYNYTKTIDFFNKNISELPSDLDLNKIKKLDISNNNFVVLPEMPNLIELYCSNNKLESLLYGQYNNSQGLHNIKKLNCSDNKLTTIPEMPNIVELFCNNNYITSLPESLSNLTVLYCGMNPDMISLPEDLSNLVKLDINGNKKIKSLPDMPKITELDISYTNIETLSYMPKLHSLYANYSLFSELNSNNKNSPELSRINYKEMKTDNDNDNDKQSKKTTIIPQKEEKEEEVPETQLVSSSSVQYGPVDLPNVELLKPSNVARTRRDLVEPSSSRILGPLFQTYDNSRRYFRTRSSRVTPIGGRKTRKYKRRKLKSKKKRGNKNKNKTKTKKRK